MFYNLKDETTIKQIATMFNNKTKGIVSGNISYIGKTNCGDIEKYITDFKIITNSQNPLLLEFLQLMVNFI